MSRLPIWITTGLSTIWAASALAQSPVLSPFQRAPGSAGTSALQAPWQVLGLPGGKVPLTQIDVVPTDSGAAVRIQAQRSYGSAIHGLPAVPVRMASVLRWRWKLDTPLVGADLRRKDGDDTALKVCLMFDMPLDRVPFVERQLLRIARAKTGQELPAATICYVWDPTLARESALPNAWSPRVRYLVVDGADSPLRQWRTVQRSIQADFLRLFGDETDEVPPLSGVAMGSDSDNTAGHSLAWVADIQLLP